MKKIVSCDYNWDSDCVEAIFTDGLVVAIHCTQLENEIAENLYERAELDWLIYNEPLTYLQLALNGGIEEYIKGPKDHKLQD